MRSGFTGIGFRGGCEFESGKPHHSYTLLQRRPGTGEQDGGRVIDGARKGGLLTTVKHFPGHGDTDTDSHLSLARVKGNLDRLNSVELVPFRDAIAAGVDAVMVGHLIVPAIEPDPNLPASTSSKVISDLLKRQLGFQGLVVTDALDMAGLTSVFQGSDPEIAGAEAVAAVRAGNDMIIIPADLEGAAKGLTNGVKDRDIPEKRIDECVLKILRIKASLGLDQKRVVDLTNVEREIARPENVAIAQKAADEAITLVSDSAKQVPLPETPSPATAMANVAEQSGTFAVVFPDRAQGTEGSQALAFELRQRVPDARIFVVNATTAFYQEDRILTAVSHATRVIAIAEAVPKPKRTTEGHSGGSAGLDSKPLQLLSKIIETAGSKTIVAAFGNPYIASGVRGIQTFICTFSNTSQSAESLVKALFGEIATHGKLPVSIPMVAARGTGLERDAIANRPQLKAERSTNVTFSGRRSLE